jgi:hypothetical protein
MSAAKTKPIYSKDLADTYSRGKRDSALAIGFGIAGVALGTAGVVLFVLDGQAGEQRASQARVVPVVGPGMAGATALVRF